MSTRTTIHLDDSLLPRRSKLINELLSKQVTQLEQAEIEAQMREGYLATRQEREELNRDWQIVDGERWPA